MISRARLEGELERMLSRPLRGRLVFDFGVDLQNGVAHRLRAVLNLLVGELEQPTDVSRTVLVAGHVEKFVLDDLLLCQSHNHTTPQPGLSQRRPARPSGVRSS